MKPEHIEFLNTMIYPRIDDPNIADVDERPVGNPPPPEALNAKDYPEWADYIRMMCAQIEAWEANKMAGFRSLSTRGQLAVQLVDLLQAD